MHSQTFHRWAGLSHNRRDTESLLREMGKNRGCCSDEGPENEAITRLWIHFILTLEHG